MWMEKWMLSLEGFGSRGKWKRLFVFYQKQSDWLG
jgi:hypothetical protein